MMIFGLLFSMAVRGTQDSKHLSVSQALDMKPGDTSPQNTSPGPPNTHRRNQESEERKREEVAGEGVEKNHKEFTVIKLCCMFR